MNHLTLEFEDGQHLRSQVGHLHDILYETLEVGTPANVQPGIALFSTEEIKAELERRAFDLAANDPQPQAQPAEAKPKPARKTVKAKAEPEAQPPAEEPEPDAAAVPEKAQTIDREGGGVASDMPSLADMEAVITRYFAVASMDAMRQVVFEVTGAKTLKAAPKETWAPLKKRLEQELAKEGK